MVAVDCQWGHCAARSLTINSSLLVSDAAESGVPHLVPVGAEEIVVGYNEFRSSIVLLQELKHALQTAEYELESLRTRYQAATGKTFEIEPRMRVSSMGDSSMFGEDKEGTNTEGNGSEHDEISDQEFDVEEHAQPSSSAEQSK
uniref:DNA methyltransferase 1-associated 1 domain-containing protein n=1 Tax=Parascaris equorum TaxID=6256 RepID=A0A914RUH5_PAREQ